MTAPQLSRAGAWSYRLRAGTTAADLAGWLIERRYTRRSLANSMAEVERLQLGASNDRALVIIFRSGAVLLQGSDAQRLAARRMLDSLVVPDPPPPEQLSMFGEAGEGGAR